MYREVKINIPMFIGIILLVAVATTVLVSGVNFTKELIMKDNERMEEWFNELEGEVNNSIGANEAINEIAETNDV